MNFPFDIQLLSISIKLKNPFLNEYIVDAKMAHLAVGIFKWLQMANFDFSKIKVDHLDMSIVTI